MNSSAYVFGNLGGGFTQYPEDYAHEIYEEFQLKAEAPSQVIIHRDKSIMYYGYIRKLDKEGQYIGLCVLLNGVMLSKMANLFAVFEKVVSEMVRIVTYLREEVIHWESTATKLPPISYSISNDSSRTFSITDKDEEIVEASAKYGFVCVHKNEEYDTPLLAGLRNVIKKKLGKERSVSSETGVAGKRNHDGLKILLWSIALVLVIVGLFVVSENMANNNDLAIAADTTAVDSIESTASLNNQELVLKGAISNIGYSMKLHISGGEVEGTEHYDSQPAESLVYINGFIDDSGTMQLYEYDQGKETGHFMGVLSEDMYSGTWSSSSGKKLSFSAKVMSMQAYEEDSQKPFSTYRPRFKKETSEVNVEVGFDYPSSGPILLVESIRGYIAEVLNKNFWWSDNRAKPKYNGNLADGQALANYIGQFKVKTLTQDYRKDNMGLDILYDENIMINNICETDTYITYETSMSGCHGGVGWSETFGRTFSKKDGHKIKILKNTNSTNFMQLLIQTVVNEVGGSEGLNDSFFQSPMSEAEPYLVNGAVKFFYQKYEIGPGALGEIQVLIYKNDILPYLTDEAKKLL